MSLRLSNASLPKLPPAFERPSYDRSKLVPGIVHLGPGAFFRAHQACYIDAILPHDPRWAVSAAALNSDSVAMALRPQDGLYTLALLGEAPRLRVIGSVVEVATRHDASIILNRLADARTRLVTMTVTEKGYCLGVDGSLDRSHPGVQSDLTHPDRPSTAIGWLVRGLARRRSSGSGGLTILSCDNLSGNGSRLGAAVQAFASSVDPELARWISDEVRFPCSMVDSITPATDVALRERVSAAGVQDAWPIQRESFTQWVIEDAFAGERPPLELAGVTLTGSVARWEEMKLRLLNGAHSTLAYFGLLLSLQTVGEAMADHHLGRFVEQLMRTDIAATLPDGHGVDVQSYISTILERFREPAIRHLLAQIAWDGSQKLPVRLLATIADARRAARDVTRLVKPVAAWLRFLSLPRPPAPDLVDPASATLLRVAHDPDALVELSGVFPPMLIGDVTFRAALRESWDALGVPGDIRRTLS